MAQTRQAWSEHALERLNDAGYRRGGARQVVIELLDEQPCALSALDIEDRLREREGRRVGRASIYRVLDELVTLGLLSRVDVGDGVARYEPQRPDDEHEHHHHLVCDGCGRLEPFQDDALERPAKVVRAALQDAASIAGLLVTTEAMVAEVPKDKTPPAMPPGGGGMGGMDF